MKDRIRRASIAAHELAAMQDRVDQALLKIGDAHKHAARLAEAGQPEAARTALLELSTLLDAWSAFLMASQRRLSAGLLLKADPLDPPPVRSPLAGQGQPRNQTTTPKPSNDR